MSNSDKVLYSFTLRNEHVLGAAAGLGVFLGLPTAMYWLFRFCFWLMDAPSVFTPEQRAFGAIGMVMVIAFSSILGAMTFQSFTNSYFWYRRGKE